jgi:hypothetical protein
MQGVSRDGNWCRTADNLTFARPKDPPMRLGSRLNLWKRLFNRKSPTITRRPARSHLQVESLEGRDVPSVFFQPQFGPETVHDGGAYKLNSPPVFLIYWGSYWTSPQGKADANTLTAAAREVIESPYLSKTVQYGADGQATFGATWTDGGGGRSGFSVDDIDSVIKNAIDNQSSPIPRASTPAHRPIYVVVTQPGATSDDPNAGGYHRLTHYTVPFSAYEDMPEAWVGVTGSTAVGVTPGDVDNFTKVFSHELVESVTDPTGDSWGGITPNPKGIYVDPGASLPASLDTTGGVREVADEETDGGRYNARLNGALVSAYWSASDQMYVVPDGTTDYTIYKPVWNGSSYTGTNTLVAASNTFVIIPSSTLTVRLANYPAAPLPWWYSPLSPRQDTVDLTTSGNSLALTVNGQVAYYNTLNVSNVVIVGDGNAVHVTLRDVGVPVSVTGNSGADSLTVDDRGAWVPSYEAYQLTSNSIGRSYHDGDLTLPLDSITYSGVSNVQLITPSTWNDIAVQSLPAGSLTIQTTLSGPYAAHNTLTVAASALRSGSQLNFQGGTGDDTLNLQDDSGEGGTLAGSVAPTYTIAQNAITYQNWMMSGFRSIATTATIGFTGLKAVNLTGQNETYGLFGLLVGRQYNIESWGTTTALNITGAGGNDVFDVGGGEMDNVSGSLFDPTPIHIDGGGGLNTVIFDDSLDTASATWSSSPSWYVSGNTVSRTNTPYDSVNNLSHYYQFGLTPANVQSLQIRGGSSNAGFSVFQTIPGVAVSVSTGTGNDSVSVGTFSVDVESPLTLTGGTGNDTLAVNDSWDSNGYNNYTVAADHIQVNSAIINYSGFESLRLAASSGAVAVQGTPAGVSLSITTVNKGDGITADLDGVQGPLTVNGGGNGRLTLTNSISTVGHSFDITAGTVTRDGGTPITYSGLATLQVSGSTGADNTFAVESTAAGVATTVNGGFHNNSYQVTPNGQDLDAIQGPLSIGGIIISQNFVNQVAIHDEQAPGAPTYTVTEQMWLTIPLATVLNRTGAAPITLARGENPIDLWTAPGGGAVSVQGLPAKTVLNVHAWTNDTIDIGSPSTVQGTVNVSQQQASVQIDASSLGVSQLYVDGTAYDATAPLSAALAPGQHYLSTTGDDTVWFTVNADETVSYDAALEGVVSGAGTTRLAVNGSAVTLDASVLGASGLYLDNVLHDATAPITVRLLPGLHWMSTTGDDNTYYSVNEDGTVAYDAALEGVLSGAGTTSLAVNGSAVTLDASVLGASGLYLDNVLHDATAPITVRLLPGLHWISTTGDDNTYFSVNEDGTVAYDAALEGVLSGAGTTILAVNGSAVTLDPSVLGASGLYLDNVLHDASAPITVRLLPGLHWMSTTGDDNTYFSVNEDGTVAYDAALEGVLSGAGTTSLAVNGSAVTLDPSALGASGLYLDGVFHDASGPFTVRLLPGLHWMSTTGDDNTYFSVNEDGTVAYDPSLEGALSGAGTTGLAADGRAVMFDASALGVASLSVDGVAHDATAPFSVSLLPGQHWLSTNGADTLWFTVNADGTVTYDPTLEGTLTGSGTSTLTLLAP